MKPQKINVLTNKMKEIQRAVIYQTTGYQTQYSTDKNFKKSCKTLSIPNNKNTSATISNLKAKTNYYVRVRTYTTRSGKKYILNGANPSV